MNRGEGEAVADEVHNDDGQVIVPEIPNDRGIDEEVIDELEGALEGVFDQLPGAHNIQVDIHEHDDNDIEGAVGGDINNVVRADVHNDDEH